MTNEVWEDLEKARHLLYRVAGRLSLDDLEDKRLFEGVTDAIQELQAAQDDVRGGKN